MSFFDGLVQHFIQRRGKGLRSWLRRSTTSLNVAGSIPIDDTGFSLAKSFRPLRPTKASTSNISWERKGGRCLEPTTLSNSCTDFLEILEPRTTGTLRACPGLYRNCFTFYHLSRNFITRKTCIRRDIL